MFNGELSILKVTVYEILLREELRKGNAFLKNVKINEIYSKSRKESVKLMPIHSSDCL